MIATMAPAAHFLSRRRFLKISAAGALFPAVVKGAASEVLGQGDFRYRVVPGWGVLGAETPVVHWGPHGGMVDARNKGNPSLLIAMSDQQYLLRLSMDGRKLAQIDMPGGNPRQIRLSDGHFFVAHLADNWPKDRNSRGFVSVLDANLRIVSNIAGTAPVYGEDGKLQPMRHDRDVFLHPHDLCVGKDGSLYVAQFSSNQTYPIKLERVP